MEVVLIILGVYALSVALLYACKIPIADQAAYSKRRETGLRILWCINTPSDLRMEWEMAAQSSILDGLCAEISECIFLEVVEDLRRS